MKAPNFSLPDQDKKERSLKEFLGKWVVLYFYPKDDTPGCTLEGKDFTDALPKFKKHNAVVIGVSPDSSEKHCKFQEKYDLKVLLLSDEEKKVLEKYNVWKEKSMYGKKYMGVERTTLLISPEGDLIHRWENVKVPGHVQEVLKMIEEFKE